MTRIVESTATVRERAPRVLAVLAGAIAFVAVDQWVKVAVATPYWAFHHRSPTWFAGSCALVICSALLALVPSRVVAVGAALLCGGALGNLLSASIDGFYVPNPLVVGTRDGVAFNVADVGILTGNLILMLGLAAVMIRNRERLATRSILGRHGGRR